VKKGTCVDVCPVACIHTTPTSPQNYIDPGICIECEQCVLVCPVDAIFLDTEVPEKWRFSVDENARFFESNKVVVTFSEQEAKLVIRGIQDYATRQGFSVAAVVLDQDGRRVGDLEMAGTEADAAIQADRKAYTAMVYGLALDRVKVGTPLPPDVTADRTRLLVEKGGLGLVRKGVIVATVGVAGSRSSDEDQLCCQAGFGVLDGH
jgi:uncharacterized protein GlcG (DUF336 family)/NAD-dependent dihydropyrimidine dehydrogenase PreA subunit